MYGGPGREGLACAKGVSVAEAEVQGAGVENKVRKQRAQLEGHRVTLSFHLNEGGSQWKLPKIAP